MGWAIEHQSETRGELDRLGKFKTALKGIGLLCCAGGLIGHLTEEAERPIGFVMDVAAAKAIAYEGE